VYRGVKEETEEEREEKREDNSYKEETEVVKGKREVRVKVFKQQ
jgi:hypothetical protein